MQFVLLDITLPLYKFTRILQSKTKYITPLITLINLLKLLQGQKGHLMPGVQIMCSIAMFCAINGFIGTIVYTKREEKYRWTGLTAFINLSIAGSKIDNSIKQ